MCLNQEGVMSRLHRVILSVFVAGLAVFSPCLAPVAYGAGGGSKVVHVWADAPGGQTGADWQNAFHTIDQAVAAARQDAAVSFLGAVNAADAKALKDFCVQEGLVATFAAKKAPTACAAILTDGSGETRVTVYPGAELEPRDVDAFAGKIAMADFLLLNNEVPEGVNLAAVEIAKQYGVKVIFNPAPARKLPKAIVEAVSIFTPNEFEEESLECGVRSAECGARSAE